MADIEKVIKGLECCTFILGKRKCNECPYQKGLPDNGCYQLQDDFHALLREQEAVKPILKREGRNKNYNDYVCPRCDNVVVYEQNYCSECGVRFLWEGR